MNTTRRNFFKTLLTAAAGFAILPPATTYGRIWRAERMVERSKWVIEWEDVKLGRSGRVEGYSVKEAIDEGYRVVIGDPLDVYTQESIQLLCDHMV